MKLTASLALLLFVSVSVVAQESTTPTPENEGTTVAPKQAPPSDPFEAQLIRRNSKVYIAPMKSEDSEKPIEGFETYLAAALRKKNVPLILVTDRSVADFEIVGTADKKGAGWAKKVFLGDWRSTTSASMSVINIKTGVIAYSDASHRSSANKGLRSSAEKLAKYLKKKIEDDEKKQLRTSR
ncbi:MAG TPA: hypothetical protein VMM84_00045 [Pyrinomonadaceae bacterium]|nr:hypothetical protein [Pyrinomonadaceae bacterium]